MRSYFITSSGTGLGKTLLTCALTWQLSQEGKKVAALKPVISGYDEKDKESDTARILRSLGLPDEPALAGTISPWRFAAHLAPNMAAAREGHPVVMEALLAFCREATATSADVVLVEGVGGVMAPLNDTQTMRDWIKRLEWPAILVAGSYLGALSHALCAYETLVAQGTKVQAVVVSESENSSVGLAETSASLKKFLPSGIPIVSLPRVDAREPWKDMPALGWLCES